MQDAHLDPAVRERKQALRQALRAQRAALSPPAGGAVAQAAGAAVARLADEAIRWPAGGTCVAVYAAMAGELDAAPVAALARRHGASICYPRVVDTRLGGDQRQDDPPLLTFHIVDGELAEGLRPGRFGIATPLTSAPSATDIDIFFVPGLGFDAHGHRLGLGRGYYDAALRARPTALRIGIGYDWQLVPAVPAEPHDELLDLVVTPRSCVVTKARAAHPLCRSLSAGTAASDPTRSRPPSLGKEEPT